MILRGWIHSSSRPYQLYSFFDSYRIHAEFAVYLAVKMPVIKLWVRTMPRPGYHKPVHLICIGVRSRKMEKKIKYMVSLLNRFAEDYRVYTLEGIRVKKAVFTKQEHWELVHDQTLTLEEARQELLRLAQNALADLKGCMRLLTELPSLGEMRIR